MTSRALSVAGHLIVHRYAQTYLSPKVWYDAMQTTFCILSRQDPASANALRPALIELATATLE